jgi:Flp pilus assembly protein TadD
MRSIAVLILLSLLSAGCAGPWKKVRTDYQTVAADPHHDPEQAIKENEKAAKLFARGRTEAAEQALQAALIADVTYGPAHNNLGKLYHSQGKLYLAAWEFEYATRLMPERPEPINNLGMVYEAAGRYDRAIEHYSHALSLAPRNPVFIGNLARVRLDRDDADEEARLLLADLLLYDSRPVWVAWAREQLAVATRPQTASAEEVAPGRPLNEILPMPVQ